MPFIGIADPEQLTMLITVLDDHCRTNGIYPASREREDVGRLIMALFNNGVHSVEELNAGVQATLARNALQGD